MTYLKIFLPAIVLVSSFVAGYNIGNKQNVLNNNIRPIDAKLWYYRGANAYQKAIRKSDNTDELRANIQANFERDSLANF